MTIAFVLNDVYHLFNHKRMANNYEKRDVMAVRRLDLVHYVVKTLSVVWPFIGIFTPYYHYFLCVIVLWILKFLSYHISKRVYSIYSVAVPILVATVYAGLLFARF